MVEQSPKSTTVRGIQITQITLADLLVSNVSHVESVSIGLTTNSSSFILASVSSVIFNITGAVKKENHFITVYLVIRDRPLYSKINSSITKIKRVYEIMKIKFKIAFAKFKHYNVQNKTDSVFCSMASRAFACFCVSMRA